MAGTAGGHLLVQAHQGGKFNLPPRPNANRRFARHEAASGQLRQQIAAAGLRVAVPPAQRPAEAAEKVRHIRLQDSQHDAFAAHRLVGGARQQRREAQLTELGQRAEPRQAVRGKTERAKMHDAFRQKHVRNGLVGAFDEQAVARLVKRIIERAVKSVARWRIERLRSADDGRPDDRQRNRSAILPVGIARPEAASIKSRRGGRVSAMPHRRRRTYLGSAGRGARNRRQNRSCAGSLCVAFPNPFRGPWAARLRELKSLRTSAKILSAPELLRSVLTVA